MTEVLNVDEFGRDLSLRNKENLKAAEDFIGYYLSKYKGMSWADMTYAIEEEEEEEELRKLEEQRKKEAEELRQRNKQESERRRYLYAIGEYELEEGEVFE